jgi:hypothetical protein
MCGFETAAIASDHTAIQPTEARSFICAETQSDIASISSDASSGDRSDVAAAITSGNTALNTKDSTVVKTSETV